LDKLVPGPGINTLKFVREVTRMKIYLDLEELYNTEVYEHKLAVILGRGKRREKILAAFPTEKEFRQASLEKIAEILGIKNKDSKLLQQLAELDETYQRLTEPKFSEQLSNNSQAEVVMCVDTEYLWSDLDSIQYAVYDGIEWELGVIITNSDLAPAVSSEEGVAYLQQLISEVRPDIFVGHNFNCDITVLEKAGKQKLPRLQNYDDTLQMVRNSNLSNIIGGASLDKIIECLFSGQTIGLFNAYQDLGLFIEYGLKDAIYPIYAREFFMTGELPGLTPELRINRIKPEVVREQINFNSVRLKGAREWQS